MSVNYCALLDRTILLVFFMNGFLFVCTLATAKKEDMWYDCCCFSQIIWKCSFGHVFLLYLYKLNVFHLFDRLQTVVVFEKSVQ